MEKVTVVSSDIVSVCRKVSLALFMSTMHNLRISLIFLKLLETVLILRGRIYL